MNLREGIVLVTGPTGSGKTTTLYSALRTDSAARRQHRDGRGSRRVQAGGNRSGAGEREGGAQLCECASLDPASGPRRHSRRRDSRQGNGDDRGAGVTDRPPRSLDAAHDRCRELDCATRRHWSRGLQDRRSAQGRRRAAASATSLQSLPSGVERARVGADASLATGRDDAV